MAETEFKYDVFISYIHKDEEIVGDPRSIHAGNGITMEADAALQTSCVLLGKTVR